MIRSSKWIYFIVLLILAVAAGIRIIYLHGDAPVADISRSGVFYVDEGTYSHNVVNKVIFNKWFLDEDYNAIANVPIFSLSQYLILNIFGVSLLSLRSSGIIYTVLSLLILFFLLKKKDFTLSIIVITLATVNYFYIIYNRLALLENLLILFLVIISLCLYYYFKENSIKWLIGAILIFWTGFFIKATILFYLPLLISTILIRPVSKMEKFNHLFLYSLISGFLLLIAYFFWIFPHIADWNYFQTRNIHQQINESFLIFISNYARYLSNLKLFQFMPITYLLFLIYSAYLIYEFYLKKKLSFLDWLFLSWAICGILFLGFFKYSPPRLSLILMPPILVLSASFLLRLYRKQIRFSDKNVFLLLTPVSLLALCQIFFGLYRIIYYKQNFLSCYLPLISLLVVPLLYLLMKYEINKKLAALILFALILGLNSFQIYKYYSNIQFSYYNAIQDMKKVIEDEKSDVNVLLGDIAPLVSIELKTKAVNIIFRSDGEDKRILNKRPNLIVLQDNKQLERLNKKLPNYFRNVELIKSYEIFNNYQNNDDTYFYRIYHNIESDGLWVEK